MRSAGVAESVLRLATTPDRAAGIVGDLVESSTGPVRIWSAVFRTAIRAVFREIVGHPGALARATLSVLIAQLSLALVLQFLLALLLALGALPLAVVFGPWVVATVRVGGAVSIMVILGRSIARDFPGRELSVIATVLVVNYAFGMLRHGPSAADTATTALDLLLLTGAAFYTRRSSSLAR